MARVAKSERVPETMRERYDAIVGITDDFCQVHLNEEYAQLIRYAVAALCRKRPSPLASGRLDAWACGVTHALGAVNFLFDASQTPHMSAGEIYEGFGITRGTGQAKSKAVRDALGMFQMDPNWSLPSTLDEHPLAWMVLVNGMIVDIRDMPKEVQEQAYEKGLIPYIPADRTAVGNDPKKGR